MYIGVWGFLLVPLLFVKVLPCFTTLCESSLGVGVVVSAYNSTRKLRISSRSLTLSFLLLGSHRLAMEAHRAAIMTGSSNVIFMSSILGQDGPSPGHKCDWKCQNEHICGNMYRCKLTGLTHICDKNCNQRILYDNHSSLCRVSGQVFPLTPMEQQAVRGVRRKLEAEGSSADTCSFKRRRDAKLHPSPFERSFSAVSPICSQAGDGLSMSRCLGTTIVMQCHVAG